MKLSFPFFALGFVALTSSASASDEIAIKTYREIFESLVITTRVTPEPRHLEVFALVRGTLPKFGDIEELNGPVGMALTRLSGFFCETMIENDSAKLPAARRAHKAVDFAKGPKQMTVAIRTEVAKEYARLFWQGNASAKEIASLLSQMELSSANGLDTPAATRQVLLGACTAAATSLDFLAI